MRCVRLLLAAAAVVVFVSGDAVSQTKSSLGRPLTFRLESFNIGLDPAVIVDTQSRRIVDMLHAKLVSLGPHGEVKSEVAEHWNWIGQNLLQVRIRSGLTFSNGQPLTSRDAVWSLCRLLQPTAPYRWLFSNVKHSNQNASQEISCDGLRVVDNLTLEIQTTTDQSRLLPALATSSAAIVPADSKPGEFGVMPGLGAYKVEQIFSNSRVVLKPREGGAVQPRSSQVTFQLVQDDSTAATLFKGGKLDVIEISDPTLYRLLVNKDGRLVVPGRLINAEAQQIRLLIFNRSAISRALGLSNEQAQQWIRSLPSQLDLGAIAKRFDPLTLPINTSYFPARSTVVRPPFQQPLPSERGRLLIITENDPYSDAIASSIPRRLAGVDIDHVGLEKSVLVSRLLKKDFDIASISLEAMMNHSAYWLSFFTPGSPFTVFGEPLQGLDLSSDDSSAVLAANAKEIDERGNWLILFQERRYYAFQPRIEGEIFLQTGLISYARIGDQQ